MPKGSHGASYARPGERETSGKIKERERNREREGRKEGKEPAEDITREGRGRRGRERKGEISEGGPKRQGSRGEPASFLRDVLTLERTALRPLSPSRPPRRHVLRRFPPALFANLGAERGADGPNSGEKAERGASSGSGEQERADSRGRETFQSLVASLLACLTRLPVPSLACLLAACQVTVLKPAHATPSGTRTIVTV